ncbi:Z1 domain-containing protein [Saccharopolyspora sp. SCSIO 74807]|uniref:Z1 domain-containing protein n=1 Tax=Saccharopolyspora sp. SCSIO 74807 TaxID=3118084 RepID=UPI0030D2D158
MSDEFDGQYETFRALLESFPPAEALKRLQQLGIGHDVVDRIRSRHEAHSVEIRDIPEARSVTMLKHDTWYLGPQAGDKCWPALEKLLAKGMSADAISSLDDSSSKIVSLLNHPRERSFNSRGLVVGYVQSGKTTNFTSVMAKAADRGYKLFIVLAGIHNGLRRQTQSRLVHQLVEPNRTLWSQLTGLDKDFTPHANPASYFGHSNRTRILCVVKKNKAVLRKLADWLAAGVDHLQDCPALIIDDEADQASVATKSINPLILEILTKLPKASYVGYTASPFANLLIDPSVAEDLYPRNFVVNLPKPADSDGYFGTEVLFGREPVDGEDPEDVPGGYRMIRDIPDDDVAFVRPAKSTEADDFVPTITSTLRNAVHYFWLVTAARRVRGSGNPHNTMLIHTDVHTSVHNSFRAPLAHLVEKLKSSLDDGDVQSELKDLWEQEIAQVPADDFGEQPVPFEKLLAELPGVLDDCRIIMDNYASEDRLDYENGPVVAIVVGGNTLSRGLTLEGLSVSYFVRSASAYDTLLQMGRWFGYRSGYADLPRIWMTDQLQNWFRHVATVEAEMRRDIEVYMTEDETPLSFAVRLRLHPQLRVTAAAKMAPGVRAASAYGGQRVQTRYFKKDANWLRGNQDAAKRLVAAAVRSCTRQEESAGRFIFRGVPHTYMIDFLEAYDFHTESQECNSELLIQYIEKRVRKAGALGRWNIAIVGNTIDSPDTPRAFEFAPDVAVGRVIRSGLTSGEQSSVDIKTLMSRRDAAVDLVGDVGSINERTIGDERRRQLPNTGLLVLYAIDKVSEPTHKRAERPERRYTLNLPEHAIGVGLVFPKPSTEDSQVEWEWNYVSADLSRVELEEEDLDALEGGS